MCSVGLGRNRVQNRALRFRCGRLGT
ncbi:hypothetical protein E2C01_061172 [Portunus trituberculatus]|uniref:Uncharacterized protein n=1 Tax=Portunus trituberculatus TaxID=210409 RepID=A0A5B7H7E9_PORTR|nr:hypothetical protein [Portunus trituberculatus]